MGATSEATRQISFARYKNSEIAIPGQAGMILKVSDLFGATRLCSPSVPISNPWFLFVEIPFVDRFLGLCQIKFLIGRDRDDRLDLEVLFNQ
jgi:hypothetical protein